MNAPDTILALAEIMKRRGIVPELEAFDLGMINYAKYLIKKEMVELPCYMNLILGNIAGAHCELAHMAGMLNDLPENCIWSFGGIGTAQLPAVSTAIAMGGGVRIGLEDNLHLRGQLTSNRELLTTVHELAAIHGRKIMTPTAARGLLGMDTHEAYTLTHHGWWQGRKMA